MEKVHIALTKEQLDNLCHLLCKSDTHECPGLIGLTGCTCNDGKDCSKCWADALSNTSDRQGLIDKYQKEVDDCRKEIRTCSFGESTILGVVMSTYKDVIEDLKK